MTRNFMLLSGGDDDDVILVGWNIKSLNEIYKSNKIT